MYLTNGQRHQKRVSNQGPSHIGRVGCQAEIEYFNRRAVRLSSLKNPMTVLAHALGILHVDSEELLSVSFRNTYYGANLCWNSRLSFGHDGYTWRILRPSVYPRRFLVLRHRWLRPKAR